ncbi:hypothetical protein B5F24_16450 [Bacteroides clarus]|uniref:Uncharacterized protein n=1 Tax=Bacteroides clarus TaxID=626929 RepID=A0A1Y4JNQ0_9BACE|nr:hypothetical protein [Bacteroides clarus]OUP31671.1 hypothetical protein B5F24_16450 [Bacteroides clarus]
MENLVFKEKIGDYTIIKNGEILVYNDEAVDIELIGKKSCITLRAMFVQENNSNPRIEMKSDKNILTIKFVDINKDCDVAGITTPTEIGHLEGGEALYFYCSVFTVNAKIGYRFFKYAFLKRSDLDKPYLHKFNREVL